MKDKKKHLKFISLCLAMLLAKSPVLFSAQEHSAPGYSQEDQGSVVGEAAKAVAGRVFGVKGEAGNIDYHVIECSKVSPFNSGVRSAFIPGWGQHFNRQRVKGTLFFLTFTASAFGAFHLRNKSQQSFDRYESLGVKDSALFDDYEEQQIQSSLLGGAAIIIWVAGIFDAYRNAYSPLYSRNIKMEFASSSEETEVRISKRF